MCRARCIEGIALFGPRLAPKLHALMRTLPPAPRAFFPSYIIAQLETPHVVAALRRRTADINEDTADAASADAADAATADAAAADADKDTVELLIDLACECFTKDVFFAKLRSMGL